MGTEGHLHQKTSTTSNTCKAGEWYNPRLAKTTWTSRNQKRKVQDSKTGTHVKHHFKTQYFWDPWFYHHCIIPKCLFWVHNLPWSLQCSVVLPLHGTGSRRTQCQCSQQRTAATLGMGHWPETQITAAFPINQSLETRHMRLKKSQVESVMSVSLDWSREKLIWQTSHHFCGVPLQLFHWSRKLKNIKLGSTCNPLLSELFKSSPVKSCEGLSTFLLWSARALLQNWPVLGCLLHLLSGLYQTVQQPGEGTSLCRWEEDRAM